MIGSDKTILALDVATTVGWAEGPLSGKQLFFGSERLSPEGAGSDAVCYGMSEFMRRRLALWKPHIIVYEAAIDPRFMKFTTVETVRLLNELPGVLKAEAYRAGVYNTRYIEAGDLKQYWHGKRNLPRSVVKRLTIRKMQALGYDVKDEDAADAIAVHRYMAAFLDPAYRAEASVTSRGIA